VEVGVTLPQFLVLTMLRAYPGLSGAELARIALLTPQTVGLITRNLERSGAVGKRPHPSHGRVLQFTLTQKGHELLGLCRHRADAVEKQISAKAEDEIVVRRWLVAVAAGLADHATITLQRGLLGDETDDPALT